VKASTACPTTSGRRARTAAVTTSVPRPQVKVSPWPWCPSFRSVFRMT
jgi:hypothetical protein